jgi:flagellar basal-body rod protein FlgB
MIENISTTAARIAEVALDGLAMQQRVIANNIANANTSGFIAQRLDFETTLRNAANGSVHTTADDINTDLAQVDNAINNGSLLRADGNSSVQLDLEMAALNQTVLKYQAIIQGLNLHNSLITAAISGDGSK